VAAVKTDFRLQSNCASACIMKG